MNKKTKKEKRIFSLIFIALPVGLLLIFLIVRNGSLTKESNSTEKLQSALHAFDSRNMNILLVTLDTTRADHLGCYGYSRIETPNIDRLAGEGFLFKNATSQSPLTLPSHSSIFTGTYPLYNGVRDNGGFYLGEDQTTLAEVLKKAGWTTSAFVGAFVLDSRWGISQGFDHYYDNFDFTKYEAISFDSVQREGGEVVKAFFEWLENNHQKKFFSWLHFYDPHSPYDPPEPYKKIYGTRPWGLYDGEIAYVDFLIGRVISKLKEKAVLDKTVIVIVADHGESLGEHQESYHGFFIYDATTLVPLIIRIPSSRIQGGIIKDQVESVDIMPSLLDLLGLPVPKQSQGRSFLPLMAGKKTDPDRFAYSETYFPRNHYGWSELKSFRNRRYKFVLAPTPELYDLDTDPGERDNIYSDNRRIGENFKRELVTFQEKKAARNIDSKRPQKLDNEAREKLMALGYIGGFTSSSRLANTGPLADPKDKIALYNKIKEAEGYSIHKEFDDALRLLDEVTTEDPRIMEALQVRANIHLELDRPEEAIADCAAALKVDENYESAIFTMALAYRKLKKYDEAVAGFERIMRLDPKDPKPSANLGNIYLETKEFDKAIASFRKSIDLDPEHSAATHGLLGSAYLSKKMLDEAENEIRLSLRMRPQIPDAHYNLGLLYEEKGDFRRAIEEYRKEIEIHPDAFRAHFNLAKILSESGRLREAVTAFKESIRSNEKFARGYFFLAKAYLDLRENLEEAIQTARRGLSLDPEDESAPLGHYVLSDIYNLLGRRAEALAETEKGRLLERKLNK